jgi:hypothetical protein
MTVKVDCKMFSNFESTVVGYVINKSDSSALSIINSVLDRGINLTVHLCLVTTGCGVLLSTISGCLVYRNIRLTGTIAREDRGIV